MTTPTGAGSSHYRTRAADLERDSAAIVAFWQANLGDPARRAGKFDWFYRHCPYGEPVLQLLYCGDELVGTCGAAPRPMLLHGQAIRAAVMGDMAVDARHRTLGPALMLMDAVATAAADRYDLLYGFPNHKSLPVAARLGFAAPGEMRRHSRVLRHAPYLQRQLPNWLAAPAGAVLDGARRLGDALREPSASRLHAAWHEHADARMTALWQASPHDDGLLSVRDAALPAWRFDAAPLAGIRYLLVSDAADAPLRAWFACHVAGSVLRVRDYWCEGGTGGIGRALVLALVRAARRGGLASLSLEHSGSAAILAGWRAAGFVPRDSQPMVVRWLNPTLAAAAHGHRFVTEADEDE